MNKNQLRELIQTTLTYLGPNSQNAIELLMLTAAQESKLGIYIKQIKGPAEGIFQMEPNTEKDIWKNYLSQYPNQYLGDKIKALLPSSQPIPTVPHMRTNLLYQICMARMHYYRVPSPLPDKNDIRGMAKYYKKHYNTYLGKATIEEAEQAYITLCL